MRKLYFLLIVILLGVVSCNRTPDSTDSQGNTVYLNDYHGKWVLINVWSSHCAPCMSEMPILDAFYQQHKNQVALFGFNFDNMPTEALEKLRQKMAMHYPQLTSFPKEKLGINEISVIPMTIIINPQGKVVNKLFGPQNGEQIAKLVGLS